MYKMKLYQIYYTFQNVILLELQRKYFTENRNDSIVKTENLWYFCQMGKVEDNMNQCGYKNCENCLVPLKICLNKSNYWRKLVLFWK